jgi:hypothetical protein
LVVNGGIEQKPKPQDFNRIFWHDKLRDITYDKYNNLFLVATSDGIFYSNNEFDSSLEQFSVQPPVSIMGINVLQILGNNDYLVGSFSGAYRWNPATGAIQDYFTDQPLRASEGLSSPFGANAIAGYAKVARDEYFFDYDKGVFSKTSAKFEMPAEIKNSFQFPLWNLAQEVHTCRIYSPIISIFYILIVPLAGIAMLIITLTGVLMWFSKRKKKPETTKKEVVNSNLE